MLLTLRPQGAGGVYTQGTFTQSIPMDVTDSSNNEDTMKLFNKFIAITGFTFAALAFPSHASSQEAPDVLVKRVSQEVIDIARNDKEIREGNRKRIFELVESRILPHLDFERATALATGRFWREATPAQRKQLIDEFRTLLVYTYASGMSQIRDQQVEYQPLRAQPTDTEVEMHGRVVQPGREPIQFGYRLAKSSSGWKIYDVNVMGVWMVETYRGNFAAEIGKGGIDGLINTLAERNKKLATGSGRSSKAS
jgi:phospholipid transport system substrate-binding protein